MWRARGCEGSAFSPLFQGGAGVVHSMLEPRMDTDNALDGGRAGRSGLSTDDADGTDKCLGWWSRQGAPVLNHGCTRIMPWDGGRAGRSGCDPQMTPMAQIMPWMVGSRRWRSGFEPRMDTDGDVPPALYPGTSTRPVQGSVKPPLQAEVWVSALTSSAPTPTPARPAAARRCRGSHRRPWSWRR